MGETIHADKHYIRKPEGNRKLVRPRRKRDYDVETDLQGTR